MRERWDERHAAFTKCLKALTADRMFRTLKETEPSLGRFDDPTSLIDFLTSSNKDDNGGWKHADLDEKDRIYAALVRTVQARGKAAALAMAMLWTGLWPGLDGIYRRRLKHFGSEPDELAEALEGAFALLVSGIKIAGVRRVACTLKKSTERDLMEPVMRRWIADKSFKVVADGNVGTAADKRSTSRDLSLLEIPSGLSFDGQTDLVRAWLVGVLGEVDGALIFAVLVFGEDQHEAAERLKLSYDAARKRLQRALPKVQQAMSQAGFKARVLSNRKANPPEGEK